MPKDLQVGDAVIAKISGEFVRCTIARIVDADYFAIDSGNVRTYRFAHELAPIEDAPADVVAATQDTP